MIKKMSLNIQDNNGKKSKGSKPNMINNNFVQTERNMNETNKSAKINNTESNAYVIFPEIRSTKNKFKNDTAKKKDTKNNTGISLPAIEK